MWPSTSGGSWLETSCDLGKTARLIINDADSLVESTLCWVERMLDRLISEPYGKKS